MKFLDAMQTKDTFTENRMPTHSTSGSYLVDLFFRLGATRDETDGKIIEYFEKAFYQENPDDALNALKLAFYGRDVRQGQGERRFFRIIIKWLAQNNHANVVIRNLDNIVEFGRWDDLLVVYEPSIITTHGLEVLRETVADYILAYLKGGDKLCAKWMPRENKKNTHIAKYLREQWNLTPKNYRQLLAGNTEVVENLMCKNDWKNINYEHVPSVAMNKYKTAFYRHDEDGMTNYVDAVKKGAKKINSSVLYPSDIVKTIMPTVYSTFSLRTSEGLYANKVIVNASKHEQEMAQIQWDALPNYVKEGESFIPVVDVSGSMSGEPMVNAVSLGLYLAERNIGPFKNAFITFSGSPELQISTGTLHDRICQVGGTSWGENTNLESVFDLILSKALESNVPQSEMPKNIIILSDMQFDQAVKSNQSAMEMIKTKYYNYGYELPKIIYWNLRNSYGVPAKSEEKGTVLVSGYSPSLMKEVLGMQTPLEMVMKIINSERYERITL